MFSSSIRIRHVTACGQVVWKRWFLSSVFSSNEYVDVSEGLKKAYKQKLLPLERKYLFHEFHSPELCDQDFHAKPMIMFIGQYSTGKTTLIRYLLEKDYPGLRIGPEPTTDRFIVLMADKKEGIIPGNALVVDTKRPFAPLSRFGNAFLNRFQCSLLPSAVLDSISIIDTPGILSGEKQRVDRGYDFAGVLEWFAERVDRIMLLFDANKLDISDEFRRAIQALKGHDDKVRIILNKSDSIDQQSLLRVYGALMWSLGKVLNSPEVARVYVGSFWDQPLRFDENRKLFADEERDLFEDIGSLPRNNVLRKLNDLHKRSRLAKVHALIMASLRESMPPFFGKEAAKENLINNLDVVFENVREKYNVSQGDFPDAWKMKEVLKKLDFSSFEKLNQKLLNEVDTMGDDIASLMSIVPCEEENIQGGVLGDSLSFSYGEGVDAGRGEPGWVVSRFRQKYDERFANLKTIDGKIMRSTAREELIKSKLPDSVLAKIYTLADVDCDGLLDSDEFALAMYLIDIKLEGHNLPQKLPSHLMPPSKTPPPNNISYFNTKL